METKYEKFTIRDETVKHDRMMPIKFHKKYIHIIKRSAAM